MIKEKIFFSFLLTIAFGGVSHIIFCRITCKATWSGKLSDPLLHTGQVDCFENMKKYEQCSSKV